MQPGVAGFPAQLVPQHATHRSSPAKGRWHAKRDGGEESDAARWILDRPQQRQAPAKRNDPTGDSALARTRRQRVRPALPKTTRSRRVRPRLLLRPSSTRDRGRRRCPQPRQPSRARRNPRRLANHPRHPRPPLPSPRNASQSRRRGPPDRSHSGPAPIHIRKPIAPSPSDAYDATSPLRGRIWLAAVNHRATYPSVSTNSSPARGRCQAQPDGGGGNATFLIHPPAAAALSVRMTHSERGYIRSNVPDRVAPDASRSIPRREATSIPVSYDPEGHRKQDDDIGNSICNKRDSRTERRGKHNDWSAISRHDPPTDITIILPVEHAAQSYGRRNRPQIAHNPYQQRVMPGPPIGHAVLCT